MRFPSRQQLCVLQNPARAPETFEEDLHNAILSAERFIRRRNFSTQYLREWQKDFNAKTLKYFDNNRTFTSAICGITYTIVADAIIRKNHGNIDGFYLGAEGQQHIATAFTELHIYDRVRYARHRENRDMYQWMLGAFSVARLAHALSENGAVCYLPTPEEDAMSAIDLLCEIDKNCGACFQIKTGKPEARQIVDAKTEERARLLGGTTQFNKKYTLQWVAIHATVHAELPHAALIDDRIHALGKTVINIIRDANE